MTGRTTFQSSPRHGRCHRRRWLVVPLLATIATSVFAQDATEPALKSALIFNFAKFTSWPQEVLPGNSEFVACVVGSQAVGQALQRAVKDRQLAGHPITVSHRDLRDPQLTFRSCHLLYVTGTDPKELTRLVTDLRGAPVLTIIDVEDPSLSIGIADLFVENGRMRFQVDNGLAKQGRLELSSRLLSLASGVRDNPRATR